MPPYQLLLQTAALAGVGLLFQGSSHRCGLELLGTRAPDNWGGWPAPERSHAAIHNTCVSQTKPPVLQGDG